MGTGGDNGDFQSNQGLRQVKKREKGTLFGMRDLSFPFFGKGPLLSLGTHEGLYTNAKFN